MAICKAVPFSEYITLQYHPRCMFAANLVIVNQICVKLSCGQGKVYRRTDVLEKTQMYCDVNRWRFFCLLRIIQESEVYQLGVPRDQGDSSAPSTTDPLIGGFCLAATTPNTRGKTVEQSIVTWMFARAFIMNRHPVAPQLTNKPCTNGRTDAGNDNTPSTKSQLTVLCHHIYINNGPSQSQ